MHLTTHAWTHNRDYFVTIIVFPTYVATRIQEVQAMEL